MKCGLDVNGEEVIQRTSYEETFNLKLSGNELHYTTSSVLVIVKNLCSQLHCQNFLILFSFHIRLGFRDLAPGPSRFVLSPPVSRPDLNYHVPPSRPLSSCFVLSRSPVSSCFLHVLFSAQRATKGLSGSERPIISSANIYHL